MRYREGFISNSSSTSFIILDDVCILKNVIIYVKLTKKQKLVLIDQGHLESSDVTRKVYLTSFFSDNYKDDLLNEDNKDKSNLILEYCDGGHGGPYDEDAYEEIAPDIWLYKGE